MNLPRLLIFASGTSEGGGSGFENLVNHRRTGTLEAEIVGVVSNHSQGGVFRNADRLGIEFHLMTKPFTEEAYRAVVQKFNADFVALSGWLKFVRGLEVAKTFNIHPGPLPRFGGAGMYGHHVHEAVIEAFRKGEIAHSAVTMHFVDEQYDHGPIFFRLPVEIYKDDTPETLAVRVNHQEHVWQPVITNDVVNGKIRLEGKKVIVPEGYPYL